MEQRDKPKTPISGRSCWPAIDPKRSLLDMEKTFDLVVVDG